MKINVFDTLDETISGIAAYFLETGRKAIEAKGRFAVALSGGSSPKKLYEFLAAKHAQSIDWQKIDFFFGDERNVPHDHAESNYRMVKTALFNPLQINPLQIFPVDTSLGPDKAGEMYTQTVAQYFNNGEQRFDLILLGLGDNSHTASLFPYTSILSDETVSVKSVFLEQEKVYRISFTAALINEAFHVAYLVYGKGKAEAVHHVIEDAENIQEYPAQLIAPLDGDLQWFLDTEAASALSKSST
ncbi:MAG: 6-phosphogluconolactonase [Siphonobacter sp.]